MMEELLAEKVSTQLISVLRRHLKFVGSDEIFPWNAELEALGLDSVSAVNLLIDLETTFQINFPPALLTENTFRTTAALGQVMSGLIEKKIG